jgi:signal transduction histidine kinase
MKPEHSLKRRIARAFLLLAIVLASFFCLVSYTAVEVIESQIIDERLGKIADVFIEHHLRQQNYQPPPDVTVFANDAIPAPLRDKKPGIHEVLLDRREAQALIRTKNGNDYAVIQEMTEFEQLEFIAFSSLAAGFVSSLLLAVILGAATARRIVAPVTALANAVGANTHASMLPSIQATDEIGVLARAFAHRTEELQRFLLREQMFSGDVSHELRTPLTIMLGAAELLKMRLTGDAGLLEIAERIRRVAYETGEKVSALLLLSRAPEHLGASLIIVNPLMHTELERYRYLLDGKPVACHFEESGEVWVEARPELVGIAIGNLLRNAFQHTAQGDVRVKLGPGQISIEDSGPGIELSVRERLFERFVHGRKDSNEGTGLGLSIVKRVVEHLGWEVWLEQREPQGSRFIISFPCIRIDKD